MLGNIIAGLKEAAGGLGRMGIESARRGALGRMAGYAPTRLGRNMAIGAGVGAAYGAFSDDTGIIAGAAMGGLGGFGYTGGRLAASIGAQTLASRGARSLGAGGMARSMARSWSSQMLNAAIGSGQHMGAYLGSQQPINKIQGLYNRATSAIGRVSSAMGGLAGDFNRGYYGVNMM